MAVRTQLIAELASNHAGNWVLAMDMIRAAADAGADWVKVQLYDADTLKVDDPQRDWLKQSQVSRGMLDHLLEASAAVGVKLTASVFGIPQAQMAKDAGLTTIKIGSGEIRRGDLVKACADIFGNRGEVWISEGVESRQVAGTAELACRVPFFGISQYPAPYFRSLARLTQVASITCPDLPWGWSDHAEGIELAKEALLYGPTYLERHFTIKGARNAAWDTWPSDFRALRDFAESVAWEGTTDHSEACAKYLNRWGNNG